MELVIVADCKPGVAVEDLGSFVDYNFVGVDYNSVIVAVMVGMPTIVGVAVEDLGSFVDYNSVCAVEAAAFGTPAAHCSSGVPVAIAVLRRTAAAGWSLALFPVH